MTSPPSKTAAYSDTPLAKKLGLKEGLRVRLSGAPEGYWELFGFDAAPSSLFVLDPSDGGSLDFQHLFVTQQAALESGLAEARRWMAKDGAVWVSWPKQASGVGSEVGRAEVMAAGKAAGLVDVKVCAVDETWSGLKMVIPVADR